MNDDPRVKISQLKQDHNMLWKFEFAYHLEIYVLKIFYLKKLDINFQK